MILTFFIGMYGEAFNMAPGNNFPNIGVILSVTLMGGLLCSVCKNTNLPQTTL